MIIIFECCVLSQLFHSPLSLSSSGSLKKKKKQKRGSLLPLHFGHKGGIFCVSEVTDIPPGNPDSWRRQWHPTPVLLPGKSHGPRSLVGYSPWGHQELDTTEQLTLFTSLSSYKNLIFRIKKKFIILIKTVL